MKSIFRTKTNGNVFGHVFLSHANLDKLNIAVVNSADLNITKVTLSSFANIFLKKCCVGLQLMST